MENIKCIFCDSESDEIFIKENGYIGRKCQICNLIYISPRPGLDEMIDIYGHDNAHISAQSHVEASSSKFLYAKHNLKILNKYAQDGKILEIGAGGGYFLNEARKQGFDVYGIELNKIQANFIKEKLNIPCEESALSDNTFHDKKFDIIYHCDVISHFYDPIGEFKKSNLKLKRNGLVIFETGNLGDVKKEYLKYITKFQYPDHLFFFSEQNIKKLLEQTGFELLKIYKYSILPQLFINKILRKIINYIKPSRTFDNSNSQNINKKLGNKENKYKELLINIHSYIFYIIRYKLGLIIPKKKRPQTIIIIGRKK